MNVDPNIIRAIPTDAPELSQMLGDLSVRHITIAASGRWSYEKLGRVRHEAQLLNATFVAKLIDNIPSFGFATFGEWAIRRYPGQGGSLLFLERRPVAIADRLPAQVLSDLQRQIRFNGNGLVVGPPGSGKSSLLLWLALQIPDDEVLLISECPPEELPGPNVRHVFPPNTTAERRALERLVRVAGNVLWERLHTIEDFVTFGCAVSARRAWFTTDSPTLDTALFAYLEAANRGVSLPLNTIFAVQPSAIGRPEAVTLLTEGPDGWTEKHNKDVSYISLVSHIAEPIRRLRSGERPVLRASDIYATIAQEPKVDRNELTGHISVDSLQHLREAAQPSLDIAEIKREDIEPLRESPVDNSAPSSHGIGAEESLPEVTRQYVNTPRVLNAMVDGPDYLRMTEETGTDIDNTKLAATRGDFSFQQSKRSAETSGEFGDDFAAVLDSGVLDFDSFVEETEMANERSQAPFASSMTGQSERDLTPPLHIDSGPSQSLPQDVDETHLASIPDSLPPFQWMKKDEEHTDELTFAQKLDRLRRKRDNS